MIPTNRTSIIALSLGSPVLLPARIGRVHKTKYIVLLLSLFSFFPAHAQQETNYVVHANIIYRFTKYINWPAYKKTGEFVIAVVGDSPLYDELRKSIAGKWVGSQIITVKKYPSSAGFFNCHILFISEEENKSIKKIVTRTAGAPILVVTESEGLAKKGSCINFALASDRLQLEINKNNIELRSLGIATELLQLGKIVK